MSDDLGRGQLGWTAERWQALDALAAQAVTENVVMRNLVDHREDIGARSVRIAGKNIDVKPIQEDVNIDMDEDEDEDVERKVRLAAQNLAVVEDRAILRAMDLTNRQSSRTFDHRAFSKAKSSLRGVHGFGVIVSTDALSDLEVEIAGTQSGLEVTERLLGAKVVQSDALPVRAIEAVLVQALPPVYRMVMAGGPRLRVLSVVDGKKVKLQLEEYIAVGEMEAQRCLAIERAAAAAAAAPRVPAAAQVNVKKAGAPARP